MGRVRKSACEPCRSRKVRCNGEDPCQQCAHLALACRYICRPHTAAARKGQQRRSVIRQYEPPRPSVFRTLHPSGQSTFHDHKGGHGNSSNDELLSYVLADVPHAYGQTMVAFHMILAPAELSITVQGLGSDETRSLHLAVAAAMASWSPARFPHITTATSNIGTAKASLAEDLVDRAISHRRPTPLGTQSNPRLAILIPLFIHLALAGLQRRALAWYYLRQAITLAQLLASDRQWFTSRDDEHHYDQDHPEEITCLGQDTRRQQQLYWVLFVQERFMGVRLELPPVLAPLPRLPFYDDDDGPSGSIYMLAQMFSLLDTRFFSYWLDSHRHYQHPASIIDHPTSSIADWISRSHAYIDTIYPSGTASSPSDVIPKINLSQKADLTVTKLWIQMLFWQLALRFCVLDEQQEKQQQQQQEGRKQEGQNKDNNPILTLHFPLNLISELTSFLSSLSRSSCSGSPPTHRTLDEHGSSMVHKLFELVVAVLDVCIVTRLRAVEDTDMRVRYVDQVLEAARFVGELERLETSQARILREKTGLLRGET